jgi:two-component system torCAD operon response regulator TorR
MQSQDTTRILIVEDDLIIRRIVVSFLRANGIDTVESGDAAGASAHFAAIPFDLVLVDVSLPDGSGFDLVDRMRRRRDCAFIYMTSLGSPEQRVRGLENADDYLVKPIEVRELLARIRAVLRRYRRVAPEPPAAAPIIELSGWTLDFIRRELADPDGAIIKLTRAEFDLLAALAQANGTPLSRDYLVEVIASAEADTKERTIDVMVSRIRRKLKAAPQPSPHIATRTGLGYCFVPPAG